MLIAEIDLFENLRGLDPASLIKATGVLIIPLFIFLTVTLFVLFERATALRRAAVMPDDLVDAVVAGRPLLGGKHTVLARIVDFAEQHKNDQDAVKAFARLELNRMERGIPYLDIVYAAAPLTGLTGTVLGLLRVFRLVNAETGMPDPVEFTKGVSLALAATLFGLCIAIVALLASGYLQRKIENYAAQLDVLLERILQRSRQ